MLSKSRGISEEVTKDLAKGLGETLLAMFHQPCQEAERADFLKEVLELVNQAAALCTLFACSLPIYRPSYETRSWALHGFAVDESSMEVVGPYGDPAVVDMVLSPCLLKKGTSLGEGYDECVVLSKAEVSAQAPDDK